MFFTLLDFAAYRLHQGRYSNSAIQAQHGVLASTANFPANRMPSPGDIVLFHTRDSFLSWLVMYFTNSIWSHSAIMVDNGNLVEVTTHGTIEHPFADCLNGDDFVTFGAPGRPTAEQRVKIVSAARSHVEVTKFSWFDAIRIGWRNLMGRGSNYHARLSVDLLTILSSAYWLGRRHRSVQFVCRTLAAAYIIVILKNRKP